MILLTVKFRWILFSFRGEVENVSANERPGRPSCFSDPEGGGETGGPDPPWDLSEVGVLCRGLMSRRQGPKVVFNSSWTIFFWLASLASIIQTYYIYIHCTSKSNTQYGTAILSLYSSYPNYYYEKNPTSHPLQACSQAYASTQVLPHRFAKKKKN